MPHPEIGVKDDAIHAIVAAPQQILAESAQPIRHAGRVQLLCRLPKLPRRGDFFAVRAAKKRRYLDL